MVGIFLLTFVLLVWMILVPHMFECRSHTFAMKCAHALRTRLTTLYHSKVSGYIDAIKVFFLLSVSILKKIKVERF